MLNIELTNGLKGASLIQHSTFNIDIDVTKENFSK